MRLAVFTRVRVVVTETQICGTFHQTSTDSWTAVSFSFGFQTCLYSFCSFVYVLWRPNLNVSFFFLYICVIFELNMEWEGYFLTIHHHHDRCKIIKINGIIFVVQLSSILGKKLSPRITLKSDLMDKRFILPFFFPKNTNEIEKKLERMTKSSWKCNSFHYFT